MSPACGWNLEFCLWIKWVLYNGEKEYTGMWEQKTSGDPYS